MITAAGVGSGIDVESIISQLMEIERQPVNALNARRQRLDVELSVFGSMKSAMNELATTSRLLGDASRFGPFEATSVNEDVFTATATGGSSAELHDVEVLSLANNHRLTSGLYASQDAQVNTGTYSFTSDSNSFDITIGSGNNSLLQLRDAINDSLENTSVAASILNVDGGSRLVLNARESGIANSITVTGAGTNIFSEITAASDAELIVDGFSVTSSTNAVTDVIEGVTLNLVGIGTSKVETQRDTESLRESLDQFVENYNNLRTGLDELSTSELRGDRLPRNAESRLRIEFSSPIELSNGETINPIDIGFTFDRYGVLSLDENRLETAQSQGLEKFLDAFTQADTGFSAKIEAILEDYTRVDGVISGRETGIENRQNSLDDQVDRLEYRLESTESRFRRQFSTMDQLVSQLQSTSSFLVNRLSNNPV